MIGTIENQEIIASEYWVENASGSATLFASKCSHCGTLFLPKVFICSSCGGSIFGRSALPENGTLYSYTVIHSAPAGYLSPYAVGYVDFAGNVRVFGHVRIDEALPSLDSLVSIEAADLFARANGDQVRGYRFAPLASKEVSR
jgi:uncharacterized OB-fold protein